MINTYNRLASLSEYDSPDMDASGDNIMGGGDFLNGPPGQMPSMNQPMQPPTNNAGMMADYPTPLLDQYRNYLQAGLPNQANYKPGFGRKLLAGLGSLGASPEQAMMYQEHMLNGPYDRAVQQYFTKAKLLGEGANIEEKQITNKRMILANEAKNDLAQAHQAEIERANAEKERLIQLLRDSQNKDAETRRMNQQVNDYKAKHPLAKLIDAQGQLVAVDPITHEQDWLGIETGKLDDTTKMQIQAHNQLAAIEARGKVAESLEGTKQGNREANAENKWTPFNSTDENGKPISVLVNTVTGETKPIKTAGPIARPSPNANTEKLTTSTRTMMEGAQMLIPHSRDLRAQANELNKRGLFGPIMSRVSELAAKIGTTGSPEEVDKSLNEFSNAVANDPLINQSNDAAVGQFITNLGLMTSGMGRVHGGARGGASIQMVNYLKSVLSAKSSIQMFNGRLDTLDSYLKGYAMGPVPMNKTKLDEAIDKVLGVKK